MIRTKVIRVVVVLTVTGIAGYSLFTWAQSPSTSGNHAVQSQNTGDVLGDSTVLTPWHTTYFATQIPDYLRAKSTNETAGRPILASYLLTGTDTAASDQTAVTIGKLGNGSLSEIAAVSVRATQPASYQVITPAGLPSGSFAYERLDHTETAVFWQHGTTYVALASTTTASRYDEQRQVVSTMLRYWQWPGQVAGMLQ